jgi:hypothetical protein
MILTSYFAQARKITEAGLVPVSIARWPPRGWRGRRYMPLAPKPEWFGRRDFARLYLAHLATLDAAKVLADLGDGAVLTCFERPEWFCHRRVAAQHLEAALGITVPEWGRAREDTPDWRDLPSRPRR